MKQTTSSNTVSQFIKKINKATFIEKEVCLAPLTTFKCGGNARYFCTPNTIKELVKVVKYANHFKIPFFLLGHGANILVSQKGFNGLVIHTKNLCLIKEKQISKELFLVTSECGTTINNLEQYLLKSELSGLEVFNGLPSSVGGAIYMNARCYEEDIASRLHSVTYLTKRGKIKRLMCKKNLSLFSYKKSLFSCSGGIILKANFLLSKSTTQNIKTKMEYYYKERVNRGHFLYPSAGSIFKNNRAFNKPTGKLIEEARLKGLQINDAQVAPFHGNIIINLGNASPSDIKNLIQTVKTKVYQQSGFKLEEEIIFVGEWQ